MVARTLGQQALPTTFGLLASSWFTALDAAAIRLEIVLSTLPVQFGGAAGTLAALYPDGLRIADALADEPIRILVVRPGMVRTRMSAGHKEAPFTCDPEDVAEAVAKNLRGGPVTVWVPAQLRYMMSGLRHAPRPVFRRVSKMR